MIHHSPTLCPKTEKRKTKLSLVSFPLISREKLVKFCYYISFYHNHMSILVLSLTLPLILYLVCAQALVCVILDPSHPTTRVFYLPTYLHVVLPLLILEWYYCPKYLMHSDHHSRNQNQIVKSKETCLWVNKHSSLYLISNSSSYLRNIRSKIQFFPAN